MKDLKITILLTSILTLGLTSCAQGTISLRNFEIVKENYRNRIDTSDNLEDVTHIKDINNELNPSVGVWSGSANNRVYTFNISKQEAYKATANSVLGKDLLKVWITVKDNAGNLIFSNTSQNIKDNGFNGDNFQQGTSNYRLNFTGACYNDSGNVFFYINSSGKLQLTYRIVSDVQSNDCPSGFTPVLPTNTSGMLLMRK